MDGLLLTQQVSELAHRQPRLVGILEQHGIDCCRGSAQSLASACENAGIDPTVLHRALLLVDQFPQSHCEGDWRERSLQALIQHIVEQHHTYLRRVFPCLGTLARKVVKHRRVGRSKYQEVALLLAALEAELTSHMRKEETVLFPWICELEATHAADRTHCATLQNPIRVMEDEHRFAIETLARVRWLADDFHAPADACPTLRGFYASLVEFERDLNLHIHEEQGILFPRAIELETMCLQAR